MNAESSAHLPQTLPIEFSTEVCMLRAIGPDDWPLEQAMTRDPDVVRWTRYPPDADEATSRARVERAMAWARSGEGCRYAVQIDGRAVGTAGIGIGPLGAPEVFYALLPAGRGRGAATAAARSLSDWAFAAGAPLVHLVTLPGNTASEAVAARAGFRRRGSTMRPQRAEPVPMNLWERRPE